MRNRRNDLIKLSFSILVLAAVLIVGAGPTNRVNAAFSYVTEFKLIASDIAGGDNFGSSLSVSGDTAVVGSHGKNGNTGAAYIFTRNGPIWLQQARLAAGDAIADDNFGYSVSISGDTAVVGAYAKNFATGAAYVFVRSGSTWSQQAKLTASDGTMIDYFGNAVSISGDTLVVGAYAKNGNTGAAYVFVRSGSTWSQQAKLTASDAEVLDNFGSSVSISGNTVMVGASWKNRNSGAAYVFVRSGSTWSQQAKLTAGDAVMADFFGNSVSVSGDTAVVGAAGKNVSTGAAYIFSRSGSTWSQQAKLTANDALNFDNFGQSVSSGTDMVVIGAHAKHNAIGAAYIFVRDVNTWSQQVKLVASDGVVNDYFGFSVAASGHAVVVGAFGSSSDGAFTGKAYAYIDPSGPSVSTLPAAARTTSATLNGTLISMGTAGSVNVSFDYGTTTAYGSTTAIQVITAAGAFSANVTGLIPETTYHFRARADGGIYGAANGSDMTFTTTSLIPSQYTLTINISGSGTVTGAGAYAPGTVAAISAMPDSGWQFAGWSGDALTNPGSASTSIILNGNKNITANFTRILPTAPSFTAPTVSTVSAAALTTSAILSGTLTSIGTAGSVNVSFDYGTTTAYGSTTAIQAMTAAGAFSANVTGLTPGTTYHFRARADGGIHGMYASPDNTFTTSAISSAASTAVTTSAAVSTTHIGSLTPGTSTASNPPIGTDKGSTPFYVWLLLIVMAVVIVGAVVIIAVRNKGRLLQAIKPRKSRAASSSQGRAGERPDYFDTLKKLADMKDQGIITKEEFESKKAEILRKIGGIE